MKYNHDMLILFSPFWTPTLAPMGPALLKAYLSKEGFTCYTLDLNASLNKIASDEFEKYWEIKNGFYYPEDRVSVTKYYESIETLRAYYISKIISLNPKRVGASLYMPTSLFSEFFLEELKSYMPNTEFLIGGPHLAPYEKNVDYYLSKPFIDVIIQGEGEIALAEYLKKADDPSFREPINNVIYKRNGEVIKGEYVANVIKLDAIPVPDYSDYDLENYLDNSGFNIFSSRGCPNKCVFCSERNYFSNFKFRKAEVIFNDIKELKKQYPQIQDFNFADSISNASPRELEKLCDLIIDSDLDIKLIMQNAVIRKEMRAPLYKKLKAAGCQIIGYGMESPSPDLLNSIGKTLSKNVDIGAVIREGTEAGIEMSVNVMFGLPGETEQDFNILMQFLKDHKNDIFQINPAIVFCALFPGSFGNANPEKWGVDLNNSPNYWEIKKDNNNYLTRLERFEKFTTLSKSFGLQNLFAIEEIPNKNEMIGLYYFHKNDYKTAREHLEKIPYSDMTMSVERALLAIHGKDTVDHNKKYNPSFFPQRYKNKHLYTSMTMINADIFKIIKDLERGVFKRQIQLLSKPWQRKAREIAQALSFSKGCENMINELLSLCYYFQIEHKNQKQRILKLLENNQGEMIKSDEYRGNEALIYPKEKIDIRKFKTVEKKLFNLKERSKNVIFRTYYEFKYNYIYDKMFTCMSNFNAIAHSLQTINESIDKLEMNLKSHNYRGEQIFEEDYVFKMTRQFSDIDDSIKGAIKSIYHEEENNKSRYARLRVLFQKLINIREIRKKLSNVYSLLLIVNEQNKHKSALLNHIEHRYAIPNRELIFQKGTIAAKNVERMNNA